MARTTTSANMAVTVVILGFLTLAMLILSITMWGNLRKTNQTLADERAQNDTFVRSGERSRADIERIADQANRSNQSVVAYLVDSLTSTVQLTTGANTDTAEQVATRLSEAGVGDGQNVIAVLRDRQSQIDALEQRVGDAEAARAAAEQDLANERARVARISEEFEAQADQLATRVTSLSDEVDSYRAGITQTEQRMDERVERVQAQASDTEVRQGSRIRALESENLSLRDTVRRLQQANAASVLSPTDEFALVDGQVAGINAPDNEVYLSLGTNDRVRIGMTFIVYPANVVIAPDANGNYPQGKGLVEITRLDAETSVARILSELSGNPILAGDNIANPVYDPDKVYRFIVYGNFDANGDGVASQFERPALENRIRDWGGEILDPADGLAGDLDFLVLGARPQLPPQPASDAPLPVQRDFLRVRQLVDQYDRLFEEAKAVGVPVLNQNRLDTLMLGR
ncbi:MAG: hypothetical protein AAGB51_05195 [Planctomycetota bacterium]